MLTIGTIVALIGIFGIGLNAATLHVASERTNTNLDYAIPLCVIPYFVLSIFLFAFLTSTMIKGMSKLFPRKKK